MCKYSDDSGYKCSHESLKDSDYCIFHLQDDKKNVDEFNKRIKEILEIEENSINLNGFYFPPGTSDFSEVIFSGEVDFNGTMFSGDADFRGAIFSGEVDFNGTMFSGDADFDKAKFSGDAGFGEAKFSVVNYLTVDNK